MTLKTGYGNLQSPYKGRGVAGGRRVLQRSQLAALHLLSPATHPSIMSKQTTVTILVLRGCFCLSPWRKRIRVRNVSQYIKCKVGVCVSSVVSYCFHISSEFKYKAPISIIHMNLTCRFRMSLSSALCWTPGAGLRAALRSVCALRDTTMLSYACT